MIESRAGLRTAAHDTRRRSVESSYELNTPIRMGLVNNRQRLIDKSSIIICIYSVAAHANASSL